jgi:hypothetical protein
MSDAAVTAGLLALALGLIEVLKNVVPKILGSKDDDAPKNTSVHNPAITRIEAGMNDRITWHSTRDANGVPLGYFPRSLELKVDESIRLLRDTSQSLERTASTLERVEKSQERLDEALDEIAREVRRAAGGR